MLGKFESFGEEKTIPLSEEEQMGMTAVIEQPYEKLTPFPYATEQERILESRVESSSNPLLGKQTNEVIFVALVDDGSGVFKPKPGKPLPPELEFRETIPSTEYPKRERVAWIVARTLGFDFVPETTMRRLHGRTGSFQKFIPDANTLYGQLHPNIETLRPQLQRIWIFDFIINNSDRHANNLLVQGDKLYAIDHGISMGRREPLRVAAHYINQVLPRDILENIERVYASKETKSVLEKLLQELIPKDEVDAFFKRLNFVGTILKKYGKIPEKYADKFTNKKYDELAQKQRDIEERKRAEEKTEKL